ncbi:hypothetical protein BDA96_03G290800 [Sorghum bicolor]|uniref:Uncharacterized protein n=1 Tax=Sorghum bicolor TaxID=4558 RepID=A0A921REX2_SORBI|nr:hypothetical protein BDA96_03G290800 [Sorghum bicolor]
MSLLSSSLCLCICAKLHPLVVVNILNFLSIPNT